MASQLRRPHAPVRCRRSSDFAALILRAQMAQARQDAAHHEAAWLREFWKHSETRRELMIVTRNL